MANRIRKVSTQKEFEKMIDEFITMGYQVESQGEDNARVVKKAPKTQHALLALLTIWWTLGIGNLIYAMMPAKNEDEVLIKIEKD